MKNLFQFWIFFAVCVLIAAVVTPWIYLLIQSFASHTNLWIVEYLAKHPFHRYFNRVLQVCIVFGIWGLLKRTGFRSLASFGLTAKRPLYLIGVGLISSIVFTGAYAAILCFLRVQPLETFIGVSALFLLFLKISATAAIVSFFEECFFRGYFYQLSKKELGYIWAILLNIVFFSTLHFIKPSQPRGLSSVQWSTGFEMLGLALQRFQHPMEILGGWLVLAAVAGILCWSLDATKSLYLAIGLHAGWILTLQLNSQLTQYRGTLPVWVLGGGDLSQGALVLLPLVLQFLFLKKLVKMWKLTSP
jgi:uncharacterized protein